MANEFGNYLHALRQARKLTTTELAQRAGIRRATLSEWQSGKRQPRSQELDAVLKVLCASDKQKQTARELLESPKAFVRLRQDIARSDPDFVDIAGDIPHGGDLLRALRLRNRWSQSELAARLGVPQTTLARWERSELWPQMEQLQYLCYLTHAHEEEIVALTAGQFRLASGYPLPDDDAIRRQLSAIAQANKSPREFSLTELRLLTLSAQAWQWARQDKARRDLLAEVYAQYADHLYMQCRFEEASQISNRVLDLHSTSRQTKNIERAIIRAAEVAAQRRGRRGLSDAIHTLEAWRHRTDDPGNYGWILGDLARFQARYGQTEPAITRAREALEATHQVSERDLPFRKADLSRVLLHAHRSQEAQAVLSENSREEFHPYSRLVQAEIFYSLGDEMTAQSLLAEIEDGIERRVFVDESEVSYYRREVELVAERWGAGNRGQETGDRKKPIL
jgi:transcriptional regulator with XRE-family HTH domain